MRTHEVRPLERSSQEMTSSNERTLSNSTLWLAAVSLCMACGPELRTLVATRTGTAPRSRSAAKPSTFRDSVLCFKREGECANFDAALKLARERASCGFNHEPNKGDRTSACQRDAACDLCQFLNDNLNPRVEFEEGMGRHGRTFPRGPEGGFPDSPMRHASHLTRFKRELCDGASNIEEFASTMLHEADHLCVQITYEPNHGENELPSDDADECHAYRIEHNCGFHPDTVPNVTGCFSLER
jgi:hypothetical protein